MSICNYSTHLLNVSLHYYSTHRYTFGHSSNTHLDTLSTSFTHTSATFRHTCFFEYMINRGLEIVWHTPTIYIAIFLLLKGNLKAEFKRKYTHKISVSSQVSISNFFSTVSKLF